MQEIEKKFLVKSLPENSDQYPHNNINQGYLAVAEDGTEIRLRKEGNKYFQTIKSGGDKTRLESEIEITESQFKTFWEFTEGKRLKKTRYKIPYQGKIIDLDIYHGNLEGTLTAEVEFENEEESRNFTPPDWFGQEITEDEEYKNKNLVLYGLPQRPK